MLYQNVIKKDGGPYSLYCTSCHRWIPNMASVEMKKEGFISFSHSCENGKRLSLDDMSIEDTLYQSNTKE